MTDTTFLEKLFNGNQVYNTGNTDFNTKIKPFAYIPNELLTGSSANCKSTELVVGDNTGNTINYFLKFQVKNRADDMALDCLNNAIINFIIKPPASHFTEFIGYYKVNLYTQEVMGDTEPNYFFLNNPGASYIIRKGKRNLSVQKKLMNSIELQKLGWVNIDTTKLIPLFAEMKELGTYGFTHNDAHLGNLMQSDSKYYLIDYGRVKFNKDLIPVTFGAIQTIEQIFAKEPKYRNKDCKNYISNDKNSNKLKFMFDISTICLNIIFSKIVIEYNREYTISNFTITKTVGILGDIKEIIIKNGSSSWDHLKFSNDILNIGLYWFIHYCYSVYNESILEYNKKTIIIDFESIVQTKHMYTYFQYKKFSSKFIYPYENIDFNNNTILIKPNLNMAEFPDKLLTQTTRPNPSYNPNPQHIFEAIAKTMSDVKNMSIDLNPIVLQQPSEKPKITLNTSVSTALQIYITAAATAADSTLASSFEAWLKEKAQLYLNDIYARVNTVQSLIVFINNISLLSQAPQHIISINNILFDILNKLYDITTRFINAVNLGQGQGTQQIINVLIAYENEVINGIFNEMKNYIDKITSDPYIQNYFFPVQRAGNASQKFTSKLPIVSQDEEELPLFEAKKIFIEHLICGYQTSPSDNVYDALNKL
jgi:hypothetical protein